VSGSGTDGSGDGPDLSALRPRFLRLDADELLIGTPIGAIGPEGTRGDTTWSGAAGGEVPAGGVRPRIVLERLVATALARPPCLVEFSGGRDSSVVLALAAHVARREGLPLPVPFTQRFRSAPESGEDEWQRLVVDHLRLPDWEVMSATDELDLTGPYARRLLRACGVVAPAPLYAAIPGFERARGGTRMTGEGGDEVFGPRRVTMLTRARREPLSRLARSGTLRRAAEPLAPEAVRRALWRQRLTADLELSWIRPPARQRVLARLARHLASEPLDWRRSLHWHLAVGTTRMLDHNAAVLASAYGVTTLDPLLHPSFVASWSHHVGFSVWPTGPRLSACSCPTCCPTQCSPGAPRRSSTTATSRPDPAASRRHGRAVESTPAPWTPSTWSPNGRGRARACSRLLSCRRRGSPIRADHRFGGSVHRRCRHD